LGLGGQRYLGVPKQPTISIYQLVEGEYQVRQFRNQQNIISTAFPELNLTANQVFAEGTGREKHREQQADFSKDDDFIYKSRFRK
jgi:hypothetical protein